MNRKSVLPLPCLAPLPALPAWPVLLLLLRFYGWLDQVFELLNCMSRKTHLYMRSAHHRGVLVSTLKFGIPDNLISKQVKRSLCIRSQQKSCGISYFIRNSLFQAWKRHSVPSANRICRFIAEEYIESFKQSECMVLVAMLESPSEEFHDSSRALADSYFSFDVHAELVLVLASKSLITLHMATEAVLLRKQLVEMQPCRGRFLHNSPVRSSSQCSSSCTFPTGD